jgi:hypothetical protein
MAISSPDPDASEHSGHDTGAGPGRNSPPRTPRWVLVFGFIALALGILLVVMLLSGGDHGPGRHAPPGGDRDRPPLATLRAPFGGPGGPDLSPDIAAWGAAARHGEQRR